MCNRKDLIFGYGKESRKRQIIHLYMCMWGRYCFQLEELWERRVGRAWQHKELGDEAKPWVREAKSRCFNAGVEGNKRLGRWLAKAMRTASCLCFCRGTRY